MLREQSRMLLRWIKRSMYTNAKMKHSGLHPEYFRMLRRGDAHDMSAMINTIQAQNQGDGPVQIIPHTNSWGSKGMELCDAVPFRGKLPRNTKSTMHMSVKVPPSYWNNDSTASFAATRRDKTHDRTWTS
jgi:hypothetical protein